MKIVLDFINQLSLNNNKEWFDKNKSFYQEAKHCFESFTQQLIANIEITIFISKFKFNSLFYHFYLNKNYYL